MTQKRKTEGDIASLEYRRDLIRKAWQELGIAEPEDSLAYGRSLVEKGVAELREAAPGPHS